MSISERFDPSLLSVVVRPVNVKEFNEKGPDGSSFLVTQGIHTVTALKELQQEDKIKTMTGIKDGFITVNVVNVEEKSLVIYGNIRSNSLASMFVCKPKPQDLLKVFDDLKEKPKQALKTVERLARLNLVGPAETKALLDICKWLAESFDKLILVLERYETYQTEDVKEGVRSTVHKNQGRMGRGQMLTMPNTMLVSLSRLSQDYWLEEGDKVLANTKSLRSVVEDFKYVKDIESLEALIKELAGESWEELTVKNPTKFEENKMKAFHGATKENMKGEQLKQYIKEDSGVFVGRITMEQKTEDVAHYIKDGEPAVVILQGEMDFDKQQELVSKLEKSESPRLVIFGSQKQQLGVLIKMRTSSEVPVDQVFFEKAKSKSIKSDEQSDEDLHYGIIGGKFSVQEGPLKTYNGKLSNLRTVVNDITLPGSRIVSINEGEAGIISIHMEGLPKSIHYVGSSDQLQKLKKVIEKDGHSVTDIDFKLKEHTDEVTVEESEVENAPEGKAESEEVKDDEISFNDLPSP